MEEKQESLSDSISSIEQVDTPIQEGVEKPIQKKKSKAFPIIVGILLLFVIGVGIYYQFNSLTSKAEIALPSGDILKITCMEDFVKGENYAEEVCGMASIYFKDIDEMTNSYLQEGKRYYDQVESSYPEKVVVDGTEYQYIYKISGYNYAGAGVGAVYQWVPLVEMHGYSGSKIISYYNPLVEESSAIEGYFPQDHKLAGEPYTSGEYIGGGSELVSCVFDLGKLFPNESGYLVMSSHGSDLDSCEYIKKFKYFKISLEEKEAIDNENEEENNSQDEVIDPSEEFVTENNGTSPFSIPEYEFSAEMPLFTMKKTEEFENEEGENYYETMEWSWEVEQTEFEYSTQEMYSDYIKSIHFTFLPIEAPGCGLGCANEHIIDIDVYENTGSKSLEEVKEVYIDKRSKVLVEEPPLNIIANQTWKWDQDVYKISGLESAPDTFDDGYLVVTPEFVYILEYYIDEEIPESWQVASNLIDSFKFGE